MGISDELRAAAGELWEAQHEHPFVRGIGDGSLEPERFRHYIRQDYLFLIDYGRLLALGAARAPQLAQMRRFAELARAVVVTEMDLHRTFAAEWGIDAAALEEEEPTPTTRAYVDFLLRTAALGDFAELVAALLPCMWGYHEIAQRLAMTPRAGGEAYSAWVQMYAGEEFGELAAWCRALTDEVGGPASYDRMRAAFLESSRLELAFWDASWRLEPVTPAPTGSRSGPARA